jgi:hypothetical protein
MGWQSARMRSVECGMRNAPYRAGYYGLSYSSTGYGGDSPLWGDTSLYCLLLIAYLCLAKGWFLLMRDRRLRDSLFCIYYAFGVGKWDRFGGG